MKKRIISFLMAIAIVMGITAYAAGDSAFITLKIGDDYMMVGGQRISLDAPATIINDRTMVPLRALLENLGAVVNYDSETRTIFAVKDNIVLVMQVGQNMMFVNTNRIELDAPSVIVNDRTLVPLRAIAESLGRDVSYDNATRTVTVK